MENPNIITVILVSFIVFAIIYRIFFNKKAIIKRKLKKAPHKKINHFRNGETAKFTGKIEFVDEPLIAPLSKRKCSYYYVIVEQKVSSGKNSHWKKIIEETRSNTFVIRDSSACAIIKTKKISAHIVLDENFSSGTFNDAEAHLEQYLNSHGRKSDGFLGLNKTIRYREGILEEGEKIAVFGKGKWLDADQAGLPSNYDRVLGIKENGKEPVYLSDDPKTTKNDRSRRDGRLRL